MICTVLTEQQSVSDCPSLPQKKRRVRRDQWMVMRHGAKPIKAQEKDELPHSSISSLSQSRFQPMKSSAAASALTSAEEAQHAAATAEGIRFAYKIITPCSCIVTGQLLTRDSGFIQLAQWTGDQWRGSQLVRAVWGEVAICSTFLSSVRTTLCRIAACHPRCRRPCCT